MMSDHDADCDADVYAELAQVDCTDLLYHQLHHDDRISHVVETESADDSSPDPLDKDYRIVELKLEPPDEDQYSAEQSNKTSKSYKTVEDLTPEELQSKRERDLERVRRRRAQMTAEELERRRAADRERKQRRRGRMTTDQLEEPGVVAVDEEQTAGVKRNMALSAEEIQRYQATEAERFRGRYAMMSPEEKEKYRATEAERSRRRYAMMSPEEKEKYRATEAERFRRRYAMMSPEEKEKYRATEAERCRRRRAMMSPEEKEKLRAAAAERTRQRRAQLQEAGVLHVRARRTLRRRFETSAGDNQRHQRHSDMTESELSDCDVKQEQDDNSQMELGHLSIVKTEQLDCDLGNSQPADSDETPDSPPPAASKSRLNFFLQKIREKRGQLSKAADNNKKSQPHKLPVAVVSSRRNRARPTPATGNFAASNTREETSGHCAPEQFQPVSAEPSTSGLVADDQTLTIGVKRSRLVSAEEKQSHGTKRFGHWRAKMSPEEKEKFRSVAAERSRQRRAKVRAKKTNSLSAECATSDENQLLDADDTEEQNCSDGTVESLTPRRRASRTSGVSGDKQLKRLNAAKRRNAINVERKRQRIAAMTPEQLKQFRAVQAEQRRNRKLKRLATMTAEQLERKELHSSCDTVEQTSTGPVQTMQIEGLRLSVVHDVNSASLLAHEGKHIYIRSSQEPKPFRCPYCAKRFNGYVARDMHLYSHPDRLRLSSTRASCMLTTEHPQICFFCNVIFSNLDDFLRHVSDTHSDVGWQLFICGICHRACDKRAKFLKHQDKRHRETAAFHLCDLCGASFHLQSSLHRHTRLHSGQQPYQCEQCGKRFALKSGYRDHMNMHAAKAGDDRFKCDVCGKVLSNRDSQRKHARLHMEKPLHCQMCDKAFAFSYHLRLHMRSTHRVMAVSPNPKPRPYACPQAEKVLSC